jgi:TetR/AcrR family transcriptional regulator, cholesterol catabolism regulator
MEELLNSISVVFKKYGIKRVTMSDISQEIGVSKKTLYQYFKDKKNIIELIVKKESSSDDEYLQNIIYFYSNPIEQLLAICKYFSGKFYNLNPSVIYDLNKYYFFIWNDNYKESKTKINSFIKKNLKKGIEQGYFLNNINIDSTAFYFMIGLDINIYSLYCNELKVNPQEKFNSYFMYYLRGISNEKGIKYIQNKIT